MKPTLIAMVLTAIPLLGGPKAGLAEPITHMVQASEHVNTALAQGQTGDTQGLVQHDQAALEQVRIALRETPSTDLEKAAKTLEESIQSGQAGDAGQATLHTKEAAGYIDAARGGLGG